MQYCGRRCYARVEFLSVITGENSTPSSLLQTYSSVISHLRKCINFTCCCKTRTCSALWGGCSASKDENRSGWMLMCHRVIKRAITPVSRCCSSQSFRSADETWYCLGCWHQSHKVSNLISREEKKNVTADNKKVVNLKWTDLQRLYFFVLVFSSLATLAAQLL